MNSFLKKASTLCLCMLSVCGVSQLNAQQLSFKPDGTFKIVQFTDVHYCLSKPGAYIDFPFGDIPICIKAGKRIFAQLYPKKDDYKITLNHLKKV